jgi:hypothetical protein
MNSIKPTITNVLAPRLHTTFITKVPGNVVRVGICMEIDTDNSTTTTTQSTTPGPITPKQLQAAIASPTSRFGWPGPYPKFVSV